MYPVVHKIKNKDKETSKSKKMKNKNTLMLLDSNPHLLSAKTQGYPLGYRGIIISFRLVIIEQSQAHFLRRFTKTE